MKIENIPRQRFTKVLEERFDFSFIGEEKSNRKMKNAGAHEKRKESQRIENDLHKLEQERKERILSNTNFFNQ